MLHFLKCSNLPAARPLARFSKYALSALAVDKVLEAYSPLNRPLHSLIRYQHRHSPVEDLIAGAAEGIEDGRGSGAGKRVLSVLREAIVDDALLWHGA